MKSLWQMARDRALFAKSVIQQQGPPINFHSLPAQVTGSGTRTTIPPAGGDRITHRGPDIGQDSRGDQRRFGPAQAHVRRPDKTPAAEGSLAMQARQVLGHQRRLLDAPAATHHLSGLPRSQSDVHQYHHRFIEVGMLDDDRCPGLSRHERLIAGQPVRLFRRDDVAPPPGCRRQACAIRAHLLPTAGSIRLRGRNLLPLVTAWQRANQLPAPGWTPASAIRRRLSAAQSHVLGASQHHLPATGFRQHER